MFLTSFSSFLKRSLISFISNYVCINTALNSFTAINHCFNNTINNAIAKNNRLQIQLRLLLYYQPILAIDDLAKNIP